MLQECSFIYLIAEAKCCSGVPHMESTMIKMLDLSSRLGSFFKAAAAVDFHFCSLSTFSCSLSALEATATASKMKGLQLASLVVFALLIIDVTSEKVRKHKKVKAHHKLESKEVKDDINLKAEIPPDVDVEVIDNRVPIVDPCLNVHCGAGSICETDSEGEPQCVCIPECPVEVEDRRQVCSNHNETWTSDCAIYQHRCLCKNGDPQCKGEHYKHVHIEYYGACREMPECNKDEMADFPRRMRDWLFNIMRDMADRQELNRHYLKMEREAENNMTRRWANAAIWKFCELDGNPPDRSISRHELFPIRAPLMSLEHCIGPFLNSCDNDNNHKITIKEWAACLELEQEEIEDKCHELMDDDDDEEKEENEQ
ncbi:unnamed protein product [Brassicogethes aeneus]|uniref:Follistatin-like domain-containing protein n=1 Tax=Brassicogethes aeneus TaxID=1431903 RepID=A0A9P0B8L6_BRAAE|nr:unnamed protein product [Brassicogethes aeneus]